MLWKVLTQRRQRIPLRVPLDAAPPVITVIMRSGRNCKWLARRLSQLSETSFDSSAEMVLCASRDRTTLFCCSGLQRQKEYPQGYIQTPT